MVTNKDLQTFTYFFDELSILFFKFHIPRKQLKIDPKLQILRANTLKEAWQIAQSISSVT